MGRGWNAALPLHTTGVLVFGGEWNFAYSRLSEVLFNHVASSKAGLFNQMAGSFAI